MTESDHILTELRKRLRYRDAHGNPDTPAQVLAWLAGYSEGRDPKFATEIYNHLTANLEAEMRRKLQ